MHVCQCHLSDNILVILFSCPIAPFTHFVKMASTTLTNQPISVATALLAEASRSVVREQEHYTLPDDSDSKNDSIAEFFQNTHTPFRSNYLPPPPSITTTTALTTPPDEIVDRANNEMSEGLLGSLSYDFICW